MIWCGKGGCVRRAQFMVGVRAWSAGMPKKPEHCCEATTRVYVCTDHSIEALKLEWLTDHGWASIRELFRENDRSPPDRATAIGFLRELSDDTGRSYGEGQGVDGKSWH